MAFPWPHGPRQLRPRPAPPMPSTPNLGGRLRDPQGRPTEWKSVTVTEGQAIKMEIQLTAHGRLRFLLKVLEKTRLAYVIPSGRIILIDEEDSPDASNDHS